MGCTNFCCSSFLVLFKILLLLTFFSFFIIPHGIDPNSSKDIFISNTYIDVGDDAISIKSNEFDPSGKPAPCQNIVVRNCSLISRNFAVGSATYGGIRNLTVEHCIIGNAKGSSPWAIKFKSHRWHPGTVMRRGFE